MEGGLLVWIVVGVIVIAAIGPLFWLLPSKRDRLLSELRTEARHSGLVVEVTRVPKIDASAEERVSSGGAAREATIECAAYRLALPKRLPHAPRWLLFKSGRENRYLPGWTTLAPPTGLPATQQAYWQAVGALIDSVPGGCVAVEAAVRHISWYGRERVDGAAATEVVAGIRDCLTALGELHRALNEVPEDDPE